RSGAARSSRARSRLIHRGMARSRVSDDDQGRVPTSGRSPFCLGSSMPKYELYDGIKPTGIIVTPDREYPTVRIHWPDRPVSDMVNLTRAKDAAVRWAARQGTHGRGLIWKIREKLLEARPCAKSILTAPDLLWKKHALTRLHQRQQM